MCTVNCFVNIKFFSLKVSFSLIFDAFRFNARHNWTKKYINNKHAFQYSFNVCVKYAKTERERKVLDLLLPQGADSSIVTDSGWNILHYAVFFEVFQGTLLFLYSSSYG